MSGWFTLKRESHSKALKIVFKSLKTHTQLCHPVTGTVMQLGTLSRGSRETPVLGVRGGTPSPSTHTVCSQAGLWSLSPPLCMMVITEPPYRVVVKLSNVEWVSPSPPPNCFYKGGPAFLQTAQHLRRVVVRRTKIANFMPLRMT